VKQEGKRRTGPLKSAKGHRVSREWWIEQGLVTLTAIAAEGFAGSYQKFTPQAQQFCHIQTKPLLKLQMKMKQGKFNIGRKGEEIVVHGRKNKAKADGQKKGREKPAPFLK
jgi:hypothetical protein